MKTCKLCSGPIQRKSSGPWPTYCSPHCKSKAAHERTKADGRYQEWLQQGLAQRQAQREANARPCRYCQTPMTNARRVQCGATECKRRYNAERMRDMQLNHKAETGRWLTAKYAVERTCLQCGNAWTTNNRKAKYCSAACGNTARTFRRTCQGCERKFAAEQAWTKWCSPQCREETLQRINMQRRLPVIPDWPRGVAWRPIPEGHPARAKTPGPRLFVQGDCIRCGTPFCVHSERGQASYCSYSCLRSDAKAKRRALERNAYVQHVHRAKIFQRDEWICKLCGREVNRDAVVPHHDAPVIDHVIPLARGGTHEPDNVQCAHFLCNSIKSDRIGGEQSLRTG